MATVTVLEADVGDLESLKVCGQSSSYTIRLLTLHWHRCKNAAQATTRITGGGLDILINNAGLVSSVTEFKSFSDL